MPSGPPYETLGQFYQMLRDGLEAFARRHGEGTLFVPAADVQLRAEEIGGGGLLVVRDLATATAAIDEIVRQGEGGAADADHSHHAQFLAMRDEFDALRSRRGGFDPARDVVRNPVMHRPLEADRCQVTAPEALLLLDFANSTYALMLRCLAQVYETRWAMPAARRAICAATFDAMKAFSAVGTALTRCEAVPGQPGRAGVSFTMLRHTEGFVRPADAGRALAERTAELVAAVSGLPLGPTAQARAAAAMAALERDVGAFMEAVGVAAGGR